MNALGSFLDRFLGRGDHSVTVPPMDGALRPNDSLDHAEPVLVLPQADDLAMLGSRPVVSADCSIREVEGQAPSPFKVFDRPITCMTALPDGSCLAGLADGMLVTVGGPHDGRVVALPGELRCLTALSALDADSVLLANGSERHGADLWTDDLLAKGRSGSVWIVTLSDGRARRIAGDLAYPCGVMADGASVIVSEAWKSRLLSIPLAGGRADVVLGNLPGYPARIAADPRGGSWLSVFAPRSQLLEFVLREDEYRTRMMREVPRQYWIAPTLRSGTSFLEPLQAGGVKQLGVLKPWAPSRSYGLLVRLDARYHPRASFHSRADGGLHGVTSSLVHDGAVWFTAKGDGVVARIAREMAE